MLGRSTLHPAKYAALSPLEGYQLYSVTKCYGLLRFIQCQLFYRMNWVELKQTRICITIVISIVAAIYVGSSPNPRLVGS